MNNQLLNGIIEVEKDFQDVQTNYFFFSRLISFDPKQAHGKISCVRFRRKLRLSFNQEMIPFEETNGWEFPDCYGKDKIIDFRIEFLFNDTIRLIFDAKKNGIATNHTVPLIIEDSEKLTPSSVWDHTIYENGNVEYTKKNISLKISSDPFCIELKKDGKTIQRTVSIHEKISLLNDTPMPCGFIQKEGSEEREFVYSSFISPDEKFFGCGESFTRLDKKGQLLHLAPIDAKGVSTNQMYKPIPFFMTNKGYGCFTHTSCPLSFDFGYSYDSVISIFIKENITDLFFFIGEPKEILSKYTFFTGRSPILPQWSFGLWMGRITYNSRKQVEEVAAKLKTNDIPCDVIHIDTGWFEKDWRCDFQFDSERFPEVNLMLKNLHSKGFHVSLWQLPYFTPDNKLFNEIITKGLAITYNGDIPSEDAILDFSNPSTIAWYQAKLEYLMKQGVDVIKADFGEAAPYSGIYSSGKNGMYEHNLYPLRYQKTVSEITSKTKGYPLIWARSAWAGSQRYPVHWGGDSENTNGAMLATLRGGLSLGLCGFTYWSHDIGGFVSSPDTDLYLRWLAFGVFTSHARCHGNPPKEPWEFSEEFMNEFRNLIKIRYKILPYIISEAKTSSQNGWPMLRTLFFEFPNDASSWLIEDEFMFGTNLLVAPVFESNGKTRKTYLPGPCKWKDIFTGNEYEGAKWYDISINNHIVVLEKKK